MGYIYEVGDVVTLKRSSLRKQRLGDPACRCGFQTEVYRLRTSDHGSP